MAVSAGVFVGRRVAVGLGIRVGRGVLVAVCGGRLVTVGDGVLHAERSVAIAMIDMPSIARVLLRLIFNHCGSKERAIRRTIIKVRNTLLPIVIFLSKTE